MAELEATADQEIAPVEPERIPEEQRCTGFCEVELGFCLPAACQEASRCLHCDYVMIEEE
jgi:hypothetical protein